MPQLEKGSECFLKLIYDGDYLNLYINDVFFHTLCRIDSETLDQYRSLIETNECDLSKIKWPRYADGTCDYDDKIIVPDAVLTPADIEEFNKKRQEQIEKSKPIEVEKEVVPAEIFRSKKRFVTNEIVEFFFEAGKFGFGFVLPGAEVKILKIGPEAEINNEKSNWVKVKIMNDIKTTQDVACKGAVLWVFGGYLE